jgi:hypothetical protein
MGIYYKKTFFSFLAFSFLNLILGLVLVGTSRIVDPNSFERDERSFPEYITNGK